MPGRKKKARTREPHEKPKVATRVSRVGTVIKCGICKGVGHNKTTCMKRNGISSSGTHGGPSGIASGHGTSSQVRPPISANQIPTSHMQPPFSASQVQPPISASQGRSSSKGKTIPRSQEPTQSQAPVMPSQQSTAATSKRKATSDLRGNNVKKRQTQGGRSNNTCGNTINVHGAVQGSHSTSNVTINVSSGSGVATSSNNATRARRPKHNRLRNLLGFK